MLVDLLLELARAQQMQLSDPWKYIAGAAASAGPSDLQVNLGFYPGPRGTPGAIHNIREGELTVGTLFRAAFVDMADCYWTSASRLDPARTSQRIVLSGGLVQNIRVLRQLIEGCPTRLAPEVEDTLLGFMILALADCGADPTIAHATDRVRSVVTDRGLRQPEQVD